MKQPHEFKHPGRIFRNAISQSGPGEPPTDTPVNIVPSIRFAREKTKSKEQHKDGTFSGRDVLKLWFRNPGFGVEIVQGDIAEYTYNRATKQYVIESVFEPNDNGRDNWCVWCYKDVNGVDC